MGLEFSNGKLEFSVNGVKKGNGIDKIPMNEHIYPCVYLLSTEDSATIVNFDVSIV